MIRVPAEDQQILNSLFQSSQEINSSVIIIENEELLAKIPQPIQDRSIIILLE